MPYKSLNDVIFIDSFKKGDTEIYYRKQFDPEAIENLYFNKSDEPFPVKLKDYTLLGKIIDIDLENIWNQLQAFNWSPNGEADELIKQIGTDHTSMSVGDMVKIKDIYYLCASIGWIEAKIIN